MVAAVQKRPKRVTKRVSSKLWSCPFCGSDRVATRGVTTATRSGSAVECDSCGASGPIESSASRANGEWNFVATTLSGRKPRG